MTARETRPQPELGALLNAATNGLARLGDHVLKPLDVTSAQWKVLVVLARHGPARVADLVTLLQHDQAATSRLVSRMERSGLVRRRAHPEDARAGVVELTGRGQRAWAACERRLREVMGGLERSMGRTHSQRLRSGLAALNDAIQLAREREPRRRKTR